MSVYSFLLDWRFVGSIERVIIIGIIVNASVSGRHLNSLNAIRNYAELRTFLDDIYFWRAAKSVLGNDKHKLGDIRAKHDEVGRLVLAYGPFQVINIFRLPQSLKEFGVFDRYNGVPEWTAQVRRGSRWYSLLEFYRAVGALHVGLDLLTILPVSFTPKKMSHGDFETFLTDILIRKNYSHTHLFRCIETSQL